MVDIEDMFDILDGLGLDNISVHRRELQIVIKSTDNNKGYVKPDIVSI